MVKRYLELGQTGARQAARMLGCAIALGAMLLPAAGWAGLFTVTPVRIFMTPKDRAVAVTVTNDGDEELVMQAEVFNWSQKAGGEDVLVPSEDLILSPPILKVAPRSRQVVRLARLGPPPTSQQVTYRLVVREVPEAKQAQKDIQVQIALAFSMPVFITPPGAKRDLACSARRSGPQALAASCENRGSAYAQIRSIGLTAADGTPVAVRESGGYLLPGISRSFEVQAKDAAIRPGNYRLAVTLDDGSGQSFDVTVSE